MARGVAVIWVLVWMAPFFVGAQSEPVPEGAQRLLAAYPDHLTRFERGELVWRDGSRMVYDDGKTKTEEQKLNQADLEDMMAVPYIAGPEYPVPTTDPGRIRFEPFFLKLYGKDKAAIEAKLVEVVWMPHTAPQTLKVLNVYGLPNKFRAISAELEKLPPEIKKTVFPSAGTFLWRFISGTNRLSTHSYGIAIDLNTDYSHYWRWSKSKEKPGPYQNRMPWEVVAVFEKHGFIWGGKWRHYDTMHFEYRPELLPEPR